MNIGQLLTFGYGNFGSVNSIIMLGLSTDTIILNINNMKNYMRCKQPDGTYVQVTSKIFYENCPKRNQLCSSKESAYVAAITVCTQNL